MAHPMEHPPDPLRKGEELEIIHQKSNIIHQTSYIKHHTSKIMEKTNIWSKILKIVITVLTAVATTFGLQACG